MTQWIGTLSRAAIIFLSVVTTANATEVGKRGAIPDLVVPENFYRAVPFEEEESAKNRLAVKCPKNLDSASANQEIGWWLACAKVFALQRPDVPGAQFKSAWTAADKEVQRLELASLSREEVRRRLDEIAVRHRLSPLLLSTPVQEAVLLEELEKVRRAMAQSRGVDLSDPELRRASDRLFFWCESKGDVIALDMTHRLYADLVAALSDPRVALLYENAQGAFSAWLAKHPDASADKRSEKARELAAPLLEVTEAAPLNPSARKGDSHE